MRNIILLFVLFVLFGSLQSVQAQNKPTKEETVAFIKQSFEKSFNWYCGRSSDGLKRSYKHYKIEFDKEKNILQMYWEYEISINMDNGEVIYQNRINIDLSKIESIKKSSLITVESKSNCDAQQIRITFNVAPGDYKIKTENAGGYGDDPWKTKMDNSATFPLWYGCKDGFDNEEVEKISKAFNHLRKLCGAPDPISFD